jgi:hypothetical protein
MMKEGMASARSPASDSRSQRGCTGQGGC